MKMRNLTNVLKIAVVSVVLFAVVSPTYASALKTPINSSSWGFGRGGY
jgi:hypothetical protein